MILRRQSSVVDVGRLLIRVMPFLWVRCSCSEQVSVHAGEQERLGHVTMYILSLSSLYVWLPPQLCLVPPPFNSENETKLILQESGPTGGIAGWGAVGRGNSPPGVHRQRQASPGRKRQVQYTAIRRRTEVVFVSPVLPLLTPSPPPSLSSARYTHSHGEEQPRHATRQRRSLSICWSS